MKKIAKVTTMIAAFAFAVSPLLSQTNPAPKKPSFEVKGSVPVLVIDSVEKTNGELMRPAPTGHRLLETKRTIPGFPSGMAGRESRSMNSSM